MVWTSGEAAMASKGEVFSSWGGGKLVFDSRLIEEGDIFLALPGANFDGHDYVSAAFDRGAAAAIVSRIPTDIPNKDKLLVVKDVLTALSDMAIYKRHKSKAKFIAVTGSVGKTSTKELLNLAFSAHGKTFASRGNYNNFLGVPINLASMPNDIEYAIFEIGMDHAGEIIPLTNLVQPHMAIITGIEKIHCANFASIEGIAEAKAEIFQGLLPEGLAIINSLSNCYSSLHKIASASSNVRKIINIGVDSSISSYEVIKNKTRAKLDILGQEAIINIDYILGSHQVHNMLAVLSSVSCLGLDLNKSTKALESFKLARGRGLVSLVDVNGKMITLIDDSYNAGPISVKAALKAMGYYSGRKIAILGDMVDMGPESSELHLACKEDIIANNLDKVICFGLEMKKLHESLPQEKQYGSYLKLKDLAKDLPDKLLPGDILLIKGSLYINNLYGFAKHLSDGTLHLQK